MVYERTIAPLVRQALAEQPAVALLGPRQIGKTTLARQIAAEHPGAVVFDLEQSIDRLRLADPGLTLPALRDRLVVIDEIQLAPELFRALRPEIDAHRRPGRFLLLGSATGALMRQSSESLAGRIAAIELPGLTLQEVQSGGDLRQIESRWLRGGYPLSWLAPDDASSYRWRKNLAETVIARDMPQMGVQVATEALRRFWGMLGHVHGQLLNASQLGQSMGGVAHTTVARYVDLMVDALLVRRLQPYLVNIGKRLVKSPKLYVRDCGMLHALLDVETRDDLRGHPQAGASWEGFVIEQVAALLPPYAPLYFYRSTNGAEIDLVIERGRRRIGVEVKLSSAPAPSRGFWNACKDLQLEQAFVVAPVADEFPIGDRVRVLPVHRLEEVVKALFLRG